MLFSYKIKKSHSRLIFNSIKIILLRVFDKDKDGYLTLEDLKKFLTTLGDRMSDK